MAKSHSQRALITLAGTVVAVVIVAFMYWARSVCIPIALAVFMAFVLSPIVTRLQRRGLGRAPAVIVAVGLVGLISVGIGAALTNQVAQLASTLPDRRDAITRKITVAKQWFAGDGVSRFGELVDDVSGVIDPKPAPGETVKVEPASPPLSTRFSTYLSPAAEMLGQAAFAFVLTIFMLLKVGDLRNRAILLLGDGHLTTTTRAVDDASQRISRYLLSQFIVNSVFGVIIAFAMLSLGVKHALLWGFIATLMRYVPYIGTWVGLIPPVLFSFATAPEWGGGWGQPLAVLAVFLGLELICNNFVEPRVYGQSMGLSEVAQLVSAALWAFLWGPIGLILSGPLTVCLFVLGRHVPRFRFLAVLLGDEPPLEPRVAFYQRLAARDQDEAAEIALEAAKDAEPEAVFDNVILPALCLARRDGEAGELDASALHFVAVAGREIAEEVAEMRELPASESDDSEERIRLLICAARDELENVAADAFAKMLDGRRWEVKVAGDETLASELMEIVESFQPAVVIIAALPPGGVAHVRYLVTRLRRQFPNVKLLIGRWGEACGFGKLRDDAVPDIDGIDYGFADTRKRLAEIHPLLVAQGDARSVVGTASA